MTETFLCPECETENLMDYRFCIACGTRLAAGGEPLPKICFKCHLENPPRYKFCGKCGAKLGIACPNCGDAVPPESRYCPNCAYLCGEGKYNADQ